MTAPQTTLVDSHAHLDLEEFSGHLEGVIARANEAGVNHILSIGTSYETSITTIEIARRFDCVSAAAGIHPHYVAERFGEFGRLKALFDDEPLVAVGETGLDFYRDASPRGDQCEAFRAHIDLAMAKDLPLIIHVRDAWDEALEVLDSAGGAPRGVFHCFSGDADFAREVLERGFFISVAGQVTFKKADDLREVVSALPLGRLLVETDCPYLAPVPKRGKTNEPAYVRLTAQAVAECMGVGFTDVARATTANAWRLFGIGPEPPRGVVAYRMRGRLYLNITNRCPNQCPWCVRYRSAFLAGHNLTLEREPDFDEVVAAAGDVTDCSEVVFCGYGEPTERLELVKRLAAHFKALGARVRLDTNGLGSATAGRDITDELSALIDEVSVSLNAADAEGYQRISRSRLGAGAFGEVVDFIARAKQTIGAVTVTAVDLPEADVDAARRLARELGVGFRLRRYGRYG